jgi:tRNA threonylcarbamoyladenosine biosynthesis protein TsaE
MEKTLFECAYTLKDIEQILQKFWHVAEKYPVIAFSGEMGAGKTTFISQLCSLLEVEDAVSSPTFALINEYHYSKGGRDTIIYHMDWYRLKNEEEAISAGVEDCLAQAIGGKMYCFIEWPEKAMGLLRQPYLWVNIESLSETERKMTVTNGSI